MGFLELQRQCGVSHEVLRGAQGASHVALGKSGLHAHCEGKDHIFYLSVSSELSTKGMLNKYLLMLLMIPTISTAALLSMIMRKAVQKQ